MTDDRFKKQDKHAFVVFLFHAVVLFFPSNYSLMEHVVLVLSPHCPSIFDIGYNDISIIV